MGSATGITVGHVFGPFAERKSAVMRFKDAKEAEEFERKAPPVMAVRRERTFEERRRMRGEGPPARRRGSEPGNREAERLLLRTAVAIFASSAL